MGDYNSTYTGIQIDTSVEQSHTHSNKSILDHIEEYYTTTEKDKLTGIASGAEVNSSQSFILVCSDETTDLTIGVAKTTFRIPYAFTITDIRASVTTAPTGDLITIDIKDAGSSILSTKLTIDATEKTSTTATTPVVISSGSLGDDAEITIDINTIGSIIAGAGLKVIIIGKPS